MKTPTKLGGVKAILLAGLLTSSCVFSAAQTPAKPAPSSSPAPQSKIQTSRQTRMDMLPISAQAVISSRLGRDNQSYHAYALDGAIRMKNTGQGMEADFSPTGAALHRGSIRWNVALQGYGYGNHLEPVKAAGPRSDANRVQYRRGPLTEWYLNGPVGYEQGFTFAKPPQMHPESGPLTVALSFTGDLTASVDPDGRGLSLRKSGVIELRYAGLVASDAKGHELNSWMELAQNRLLLRVDDVGAAYPIAIDPMVQATRLTNDLIDGVCLEESDCSHGAANDEFGRSVAVSGDGQTIAVGAPQVNGDIGAVYVFLRPGAGWGCVVIGCDNYAAMLVASDGAAISELGSSVSISSDGSVVAAGAPFSTVGYDIRQGAIYVFVKPSAGWSSSTSLTEATKLVASDGTVDDYLGLELAVSGDGATVVAGNFNATIGANADQGEAYVFTEPSGGWGSSSPLNETARLTAADGAAFDQFGSGVAIGGDGTVVAAGAPSNDSLTNYGAGAVYVFEKPSGGWATTSTFKAKLIASDGGPTDELGAPVAMSVDNNTIVALAPDRTTNPSNTVSTAYVFLKPGSGWTTTSEVNAELYASNNLGILSSLAVSGDGSTIALGGPTTTLAYSEQGVAYIFVKPLTGWASGTETRDLTASDAAQKQYFGGSVGLNSDGTTAVVGAELTTVNTNADQGAVYIFTGSAGSPMAMAAPGSLTFSSNAGLPSAAQTVTLTNSGTVSLNVTGVSAPSPFTTTQNCIAQSPLAPGAQCSESVVLGASAAGSPNGTLTFTDDSGGTAGNTQTVNLSSTVSKAPTTIGITSISPDPTLVDAPVTVTWSVYPPSGDTLVPTGSVTATASTGEVCSGAVASGQCTLTFLTPVNRNISASYGGDTNFTGNTSSSVSETVVDYSMSVTPGSQTVSAGHAATFTVKVSSVNTFAGIVSLGCTGAPPGSTCTISPNSVGLVNSSATATMTISPSKTMSKGTYRLSINGTSGTDKHAITATLTEK